MIVRASIFWGLLVLIPMMAIVGPLDQISPRAEEITARVPNANLSVSSVSPQLDSDGSSGISNRPEFQFLNAERRSDDLQRLPSVPTDQERWFERARDELRRLGATYVRLERWDGEVPVYCFRCRIDPERTPANASRASKSLYALSTSAEAATLDVVRQVRQSRPSEAARQKSAVSR